MSASAQPTHATTSIAARTAAAPERSERAANGELEALELIAISELRRSFVAQGNRVAEPEQAEWREPLHGNARRCAQLPQAESVVDGEARFVRELRAAHVVVLAEIDEPAHARALLELLRYRHEQLELPAEREVTAVRIAQ